MTPDQHLEYQALVRRHDMLLHTTPEPSADFSWDRVQVAGERAIQLFSLRNRIIELERMHPELRLSKSPDSERNLAAALTFPVAPRYTHSGAAANMHGAPLLQSKADPVPVAQQTRNPTTQRKRRLSLTNPAYQASFIEAKMEEEARKKNKGTAAQRKPSHKRTLTLGELYQRSREESEWAIPSQRLLAEEKEQAKVKSQRILKWLDKVEPTSAEKPEVMRRKRKVVFGNMEEQTIEFSGFRGEGESV